MQRRRGAYQEAFGVRAPVLPGRVADLREVLADMAAPAGEGTVARVPFAQLAGVHFGRLLLLEDAHDLEGALLPASLILMTEIDEPSAHHVRELADAGGAGLDAAFGLCTGYPEGPTPAERERFLHAHVVRPDAMYVNTVGRTVEQIHREEQLRRARAAIQQFVRDEPALAWARRRAPVPPLGRRLARGARTVAIALGLVLALPLLLVIVPLWALVLRFHEAHDPAPHVRPTRAHAEALFALEDFAAQNQFSAVGLVKPGRFRRLTIAAVLFLIDYAARVVYRRGDLSGIKTIHFARWTILDDGRRAIFTSDYDGSLESYMDDFVDKVAFGLNASFSHGVGYPRTRFLFFGGAKREDEFKDFLRIHQVPTQVFYSAYDQLSARNLDNNALLRSGLFVPMGDAEAAAWLRRV